MLVLTRCNSIRRYPCAESVLGDGHVQPYTHDCVASVRDGGHKYMFIVFLKCHHQLSHNQHFPLHQGDILIMKIGKNGFVVNMGGRDSALAKFVIKSWVFVFIVTTFAMCWSLTVGSCHRASELHSGVESVRWFSNVPSFIVIVV